MFDLTILQSPKFVLIDEISLPKTENDIRLRSPCIIALIFVGVKIFARGLADFVDIHQKRKAFRYKYSDGTLSTVFFTVGDIHFFEYSFFHGIHSPYILFCKQCMSVD